MRVRVPAITLAGRKRIASGFQSSPWHFSSIQVQRWTQQRKRPNREVFQPLSTTSPGSSFVAIMSRSAGGSSRRTRKPTLGRWCGSTTGGPVPRIPPVEPAASGACPSCNGAQLFGAKEFIHSFLGAIPFSKEIPAQKAESLV